MDPDDRDRIARELFDALESGEPVSRLTADHDLTIEEAYRIQDEFIARRETEENSVVGHKIGLTSEGIQEQLSVAEPDFGRLLAEMHVRPGAVAADDLIDPRIEPEIGFLLAEGLEPPVTPFAVLAATDRVFPVLEIIDSRIADWDIRIQDTIADNASAGLYVTGDVLTEPSGQDFSFEGVKLWKNGEVAASGIGANVLGHPANAVAWLANTLGEMGDTLKAGQTILSGSFTPATDVTSGDVITAEFGSIGSVTAGLE